MRRQFDPDRHALLLPPLGGFLLIVDRAGCELTTPSRPAFRHGRESNKEEVSMTNRFIVLAALVCAQPVFAQPSFDGTSALHITGDAAILVVPDRVRLFPGVEARNKDLRAAKTDNDAAVRKVIEAARALNVAPGNIQTDYIQVGMSYNGNDGTIVDHYTVTKDIQILLTDVPQFENLLSQVLLAGANHIYDVEFSTSELRTHRDAVRALAIKAAQDKATALAAAAGLRVIAPPLSVSAYSYGGGSAYGHRRSGGYGQAQNVTQASGGDGIGADGTVALGKISVTANVSMTFQTQR